jgi:hypothetical protein
MMHDATPESTNIEDRLQQESLKLDELQARWNEGIGKLKGYFGVEEEYDNPNNLLRSLEQKTLEEFDIDERPIVLGFAGPGGAGKGTVREQLGDSVKSLQGVNSTTRDRRDYEVDGIHYHFVTTEDLVEGTSLTDDSIELVKEFLNISGDFVLTSKVLDDIGNKIENENIKDGITLTVNQDSKYLNLTYRPGRGWYGMSSDTFEGLRTGDLVTIEESGPNLVLIGESFNKQEINYSVVYILPPQPIARTMAKRALLRDGIDQSSENLFSTIGERQVNEFEVMVELLLKSDVSFILLVNDDLLPSEDDKVITRTGVELIKKFK